ncbi:MAG: hypothetical protein HOE90_15610 [Bacteriovoracaceae bacterium]|nr:hypothetical protein [Bacteriovoracaceae bacterium]
MKFLVMIISLLSTTSSFGQAKVQLESIITAENNWSQISTKIQDLHSVQVRPIKKDLHCVEKRLVDSQLIVGSCIIKVLSTNSIMIYNVNLSWNVNYQNRTEPYYKVVAVNFLGFHTNRW